MVTSARTRYTNPWELPDPLSGSSPSWETWSNNLDPYGTRYQSALDWGPPQEYAYGQPYRPGEEYTPTSQGESYTPIAVQLGSSMTDYGIDQWLQQYHPELFQFGETGYANNPGVISSPNTPEWSAVNKWDPMVIAAVRKVAAERGIQVPLNLVKAIMRVESGGVWTDRDPGAGAIGVMQVMPFWGDDLGLNLLDPAQNIEAGVRILASNYEAGNPENGEDSWEWAARRYLGLGGPDINGTDHNIYWNRVSKFWNELGTSATMPGQTGGSAPPAGTTNFNAIWGGFDAPISQEYGWTDFARNSGSYYNYSAAYTRDRQPMGHPALDVGIVVGTKLYSPVSGTVVIAGGSGFYCDNDPGGNGCGPQVGHLEIETSTGDRIILGHMRQITVQPGNQIAAGMPVGFSGSENGGHVHVEYRKWVGEGITTSGYEVIDPRLALQGIFTGTFGSTGPNGQAPVFAASPYNWNSFMRAATLGLPLSSAPLSGTFGDWLRAQMGVGPSPVGNVENNNGAPSGWSWQNFDPNPGGSTNPGGVPLPS